MKKIDNLKEERKGFWAVGYLEQQDYVKRMLELTHKEMLQTEIDEQISGMLQQKPFSYYDKNFGGTSEIKAIFMTFATGINAFRTNNSIIAGFHRMNDKDDWRGVYLEQDLGSLQTILENKRHRCALEDYSYIYHYDRISEQCNETFGQNKTVDEWANYVGILFEKRLNANEIYSFNQGSYFKCSRKSPQGDELFLWMERNDKPGAKQKGFGISLITLDNLLEKWAEEYYNYTLDRLIFGTMDDLEEFVNSVSEDAMEENWGRINPPNQEASYGHPVLKSYIEYTLVRLRSLDKNNKEYIIRENGRAYYNTGLLNKYFRQILINAELKIETDEVPGIGKHDFEFMMNPKPLVAGNDNMFVNDNGELRKIPRIANYFEKKDDVLYDASLEIMLNDEHIFEDGLRAGRIPMFFEEYQKARSNQEERKRLVNHVQARVETAIHRAQLLAERNHKLAVPQFWKEDGEVQFLLPLYMDEKQYVGIPQCALALRRAGSGGYYEGATILSLDMAYNNARLIAKPDVTWLNRKEGLEIEGYKMAHDMAMDEVISKHEAEKTELIKQIDAAKSSSNISNVSDEEKNYAPPKEDNIGKMAMLTKIGTRSNNKGLKGEVLGSAGTIANNLLKKQSSKYVGKKLKVKIIEINPQGTQYILEPLE